MALLARLSTTVGVSVLSLVVYVISVGYRRRTKINALRKQGMAMPKWDWWMGHLTVLKDHLDKLPPDANVYYAMHDLVLKEHADTEIFLMDYWPIHEPVLMISNPAIASQVSSKFSLPKPQHSIARYVPILGGNSLITMNGDEAKTWRSLFSPGFSASHMLDLNPMIIDSVEVFCQLLAERAAADEMFSLTQMTTRLTMEIINKVTLDADLNNQRHEHFYAYALKTITAWHSFWDPRILLHPARPFVQRYYSRIVHKFIESELSSRFSEMKHQRLASTSAPKSKRAKSVMALALDAYITQYAQTDSELEALQLDPELASLAVNQIRLFVYAGNDSTSTTIDYTFHRLSKHPSALAAVRAEHERVFGPDASTVASQLKEQPALLNRMPYTLAVIKEVLRLHPPASSLKEGRPGISLTDDKGNTYPTDGLGATIMHYFIHRNPRYWPRADEFLPERWLASTSDELYVNAADGAFRPFELGSRNCIASTLVYNELRIVVALTVRRFEFAEAYAEWDEREKRSEGILRRLGRGLGLVGEQVKTVYGERAYQTGQSGAHPADGYPCRVKVVGKW